MLALKLGISLPSLKSLEWSPSDDTNLEAWYRYRTGLTTVGGISPVVSAWADSSPNDHEMVQATVSERPNFTLATGALTFTAANTENLQTATSITLAGDFTIGIKFTPTATNTSIMGSNTIANEFLKIMTSVQFRIKIDGSSVNINLDSGSFGNDYIVLTRSSNVLNLWHNGVVQTGTPTLSGTADIDAIGVRLDDLNPYDGDIKEIQIYTGTSADLTTNVNHRLASLVL